MIDDHIDEPATGRRARSLGSNYRRVYAASVISNLGDGVAQIGYPWLASAVTRNPILVALVAVAQRLPWLVFTLPAGVITDRVDRRRAIVLMDSLRAGLTVLVAIAVLGLGDSLPEPDALEAVTGTRTGLYAILLVATLLLGMAEVLRDNSAQTIIPAIVAPEHLERANGRMWSAEQVANTFIGPPLGSFLLAGAFFLPFVLDAASFAVAAALVFLVTGQFRARSATGEQTVGDAARTSGKTELAEGVRWLMAHPLLRPMAIVLGVMNAVGMLWGATLILFAQEVLDTSPLEFAFLSMGLAVGAVAGGYATATLKDRLGTGPTLWLTLISSAVLPIPVAFTSWWPLVFFVFVVYTFFGVAWNVITVSLRQTIIPDHLLGRVNSVYRFFAWGMMPIGTIIGGLTVAIVEPWQGREAALRAPWLVAAVLGTLLLFYAIPRLTSEKMDAARAEARA